MVIMEKDMNNAIHSSNTILVFGLIFFPHNFSENFFILPFCCNININW